MQNVLQENINHKHAHEAAAKVLPKVLPSFTHSHTDEASLWLEGG